MSRPSHFSFEPNWPKHLLCHTPWGRFTVEMEIGERQVYFPDETRWLQVLPNDLYDKWPELVRALQDWCELNAVPLSLCSDAWIKLHDQEIA